MTGDQKVEEARDAWDQRKERQELLLYRVSSSWSTNLDSVLDQEAPTKDDFLIIKIFYHAEGNELYA